MVLDLQSIRHEFICILISNVLSSITALATDRLLLDAAGGAAGLSPVRQRAEVHLPDDLGEQLVHHGLALGGRLHEGAAPVLRQSLALAGGHFPLVLQVHLVPHQDHRDLLVPGRKRHLR